MEKILLIEDDDGLALGSEYALKKEGFTVSRGEDLKGGR